MIRTVGKMRSGDEVVVIFDAGVAALHTDLVTEIAHEDGIVRMSFAAITQDGDGTPQANIVARLRMKEDTAYGLCRALKALEG